MLHSVTINGTTITEYTGYSHPLGIAKGPDGNIWFTDQGSQTVNALSPSNPATLVYNYGVSGSDLFELVAGPDGAMWMSDDNLEGVDRMTTAGVLTQYSLPSGGSPRGITYDTAGQLWVADDSSDVVWMLSAGGAFSNPGFSPSGQPISVVVGPDGAIWFTEGANIGRYNPADSSFTETAVPSSGTAAYIATGPDNAIWFTGNASGNGFVARIPMTGGDGPFTATPFTTGTNPLGIAAGADNAMWFVDKTANTVGEISLTSHTITTLPNSDVKRAATRNRARPRRQLMVYGEQRRPNRPCRSLAHRQAQGDRLLLLFHRYEIHFVTAPDRIERLEAFGHLAEHGVVLVEKACVG